MPTLNDKYPRHVPIGLYVFALIAGIGMPTLSLASRFRVSDSINTIFRNITNQQSLLEHLLGGIGAIGIAAAIAIAIWKTPLTKVKFRKTKVRKTWFQKGRKFISRSHQQIAFRYWMIFAAAIYMAGEISWETKQAVARGLIQYDQLACDLAGVFIGCLLAWQLTNKVYSNARNSRKLHYVKTANISHYQSA